MYLRLSRRQEAWGLGTLTFQQCMRPWRLLNNPPKKANCLKHSFVSLLKGWFYAHPKTSISTLQDLTINKFYGHVSLLGNLVPSKHKTLSNKIFRKIFQEIKGYDVSTINYFSLHNYLNKYHAIDPRTDPKQISTYGLEFSSWQPLFITAFQIAMSFHHNFSDCYAILLVGFQLTYHPRWI